MLYFIVLILPLYVMFVLCGLISIVVAYSRPQWRHVVPSLAWGLLGSFAGLVILNLLFTTVGAMLFWFPVEQGGAASMIKGAAGGIVSLLGPFFASLVGVVGDYAWGFFRGPRSKQRRRDA